MSIYSKLYPWQKKIVDNFKDRTAFGLFLDMGLGKTPLSLAFAEQNECTKVLVVTINSKAEESEDLEGSWLNWSSFSNINYNKNNKKVKEFNREASDIFVVNYEMLFKRAKREEVLSRRNPGLQLSEPIMNFIFSCKGHNVALIIDESHKTKSKKSKQSEAIEKIQKALKLNSTKCYTYLLTGTPFTTGYIDLYNQLRLLGCTMTKGLFEDNFCERGHIRGLLDWQQPIVGYKNVELLYDLVHKYAITIDSEEVIDLPEKIFVNHRLEESTEFSMFTTEKMSGHKILDYMEEKEILSKEDILTYDCKTRVNNPFYRNIAYPYTLWEADTVGTFWMRARQLSIGFQGNNEDSQWFDRTRLNLLEKLLEEEPDNYIIFYNYTPELLEIYDICEKLKYNIDVYCGPIKSETFYEAYSRQSLEKRLTNKKNVIISNFASGSTGKNWQNYNKCILFSLPLYMDYEQGCKRIHRHGQKSSCIYHLFWQDNWLDRGMKQALEEKKNYSEDMFESDLSRVREALKGEY